MKRIFALIIALTLALASLAGACAEVLTIDPATATDEELASAVAILLAEQRARIVTTIALSEESMRLPKGKSETLEAQIKDLPDDLTASKFTWTSSDEAVATVSSSGKVSGKANGTAVIRCTSVLSDETEIYSECEVTVYVQVTGLSVKNSNLKISVGESANCEVTIKPADATVTTLRYESSDESVASVDAAGNVTARGAGKCKITATSTDGSEKTTSVNVTVPSLGSDAAEYTVTSKKGGSYEVHFYGSDASAVSLSNNGKSNADVTMKYDSSKKVFVLSVVPLKAGSASVTLTDKNDSSNKLKITFQISHDAVYDSTGYPAIKYTDASRYPGQYEGQKVSFSGKVLQVMSGYGYTQLRISSKGSYDDVVYVQIDDDDMLVPIIEDDRVTVYGTYDGTYSYTSVMGAQITLPLVIAERINLRK